MKRKKKPSPLAEALRETAEAMHVAGILDDASRERIIGRLDRTAAPTRRQTPLRGQQAQTKTKSR